MPLYSDSQGRGRIVHNGYEGTKYTEYLKPKTLINYGRIARFAGAGLLFSAVYFAFCAKIEVGNSRLSRDIRAENLGKLQEEDAEVFTEMMARGKIATTGLTPVERPMSSAVELLKKAFPDDFKDK